MARLALGSKSSSKVAKRAEAAGLQLFAVYLGGKTKGASIEVHDIAFVVGSTLEDTYPQLREKWFGTPESIHIDSWVKLDEVDGHSVELSTDAPRKGEPKLYFVNIGSYTRAVFGENHDFRFLVSSGPMEARSRAKAEIVAQKRQLPHTDNLAEIDSLIQVKSAGGLYIRLKPNASITRSKKPKGLKITNTYLPIAIRN